MSDRLFECKTAAQHTKVISMLVIPILFKVIRTDKHMQHIYRMLNAKSSAFSLGRDSCEMFLNRPSLIIFPFKYQDKEYQTAVLFREGSRLEADKISFFILCLLLHSLCHGA